MTPDTQHDFDPLAALSQTADANPAARIRGRAHGTAPVPLSVLDLLTVGTGSTAADALRTGVALCRLAESRGFHRHWIAEHHSMPGVAASSPAVILAHLAAHTERIRLGSGGVMLPNHPPLVVAEQFGTLEAMAPGRVDLGVGRAPGTDEATAGALRRTGGPGEEADDFPQRLAQLIHFLDDDVPDGHPHFRVHAIPGPAQETSAGAAQPRRRPPVWLLGSSGLSASMAGMLGLPFAFAHHISSRNTLQALDLYRRSFRPSDVLDAPYAMLSVAALAADDEKEAGRHVRAGALHTIRLRAGRPGLFPAPEEADSHVFTPQERDFADTWAANIVHGTGEEVRTGLDELQQRTQADELMLTCHTHTGDVLLRSYELIADAYELPTD